MLYLLCLQLAKYLGTLNTENTLWETEIIMKPLKTSLDWKRKLKKKKRIKEKGQLKKKKIGKKN